MIRLQHVTKTYPLGPGNVITAVRDVSLTVEHGEFLILTGRSGSGKTSLLNLAAGLARPTSGAVWLREADLWKLSDHQQSLLRNQLVGFIFQFPSLLPALTVLENTALPALFGQREARAGAEARAVELLERVGLTDKLQVYPRQLSAGQQQRVVIARALLNRPEVLLADEPTSNLDEQTEQEIMELLRAIHAQTGITIVMVTHTSQLLRFGTRAVEMSGGSLQTDRPILAQLPALEQAAPAHPWPAGNPVIKQKEMIGPA